MDTYVRIPLRLEKGKRIYYNQRYLQKYKNSLLKFLDGEDYMRSLEFAKKAMETHEIKVNNNIEGFLDDIDIIEKTIMEDDNILSMRKDRIINLHKGYNFILNNHKIDKNSLKELYAILSKSLLDEYSVNHMGEFYRNGPVFIYTSSRLDTIPYKGMKEEKIEKSMDILFDYINNEEDKTEFDSFLKSQIIHFYFVYIHPYFDVNGRTARTTAMWHLLNKESYPYIIFNRAISYNKIKYTNAIINSRKHGDITLFLKYILKQVQFQLEKERTILDIKENVELTNAEEQIIEYLLLLKSGLTILDLSNRYNAFNVYKSPEDFTYEFIFPLMAKNVILNCGKTTHNINEKLPNLFIALNKDFIKNSNKNNYLNIKKYTR